MYEAVVRPILFSGDPERAHDLTLKCLARVPRRLSRVPSGQPREVFGIKFPNVVGLAAGVDKDGVALHAWPTLGFGFVEVGTVTRWPQEGNPRPRLFRQTRDETLVNYMGFNNVGAVELAARLRSYGQLPVPLGVSIGKSRVTPLADATEDYLTSLHEIHSYADYVVLNISSPNTPELRSLQCSGQPLHELIAVLRGYLATHGNKPLLVKVSPDLSHQRLYKLIETCENLGVSGIVATNTPVGGLSGKSLFAFSYRVVSFICSSSSLPVIAVGGISSVDDANAMLDAGASLVQLYTGFIFHGPALVRAIAREASVGVSHGS